MIEGFWAVRFSSNQASLGAGVVLLEGGKAYGGDSSFSYIGTYDNESGSTVVVKLRIERHSNVLPNVAGDDLGDYDLELLGQPGQRQFSLKGNVVQSPSRTLEVSLTRKTGV